MENSNLSTEVIEPGFLGAPKIGLKFLNPMKDHIRYHEKLLRGFPRLDDFVAFFNSNDQGIRLSLYPPVFHNPHK